MSKIFKNVEIEVENYTLNTIFLRNVNFIDYQDNKISINLVYIDESDFLAKWTTDDDLKLKNLKILTLLNAFLNIIFVYL